MATGAVCVPLNFKLSNRAAWWRTMGQEVAVPTPIRAYTRRTTRYSRRLLKSLVPDLEDRLAKKM